MPRIHETNGLGYDPIRIEMQVRAARAEAMRDMWRGLRRAMTPARGR